MKRLIALLACCLTAAFAVSSTFAAERAIDKEIVVPATLGAVGETRRTPTLTGPGATYSAISSSGLRQARWTGLSGLRSSRK